MTGKQYQIWEKYIRNDGLLIVLSGPSGVGKDAVLSCLQNIYPAAKRCVTTTTRPPRHNEIDGIDYNFISRDEFQRRIDQNEFIEYAEYAGNLYGTPRNWVEKQLFEGYDVVLKIEVQGGLEVKRQISSAVMIFLVPPSFEELEKRLRNRLTDSEDAINKRLQTAKKEIEMIPSYDYLLINDNLDKAAEDLRSIIIAEHSRIKSQSM